MSADNRAYLPVYTQEELENNHRLEATKKPDGSVYTQRELDELRRLEKKAKEEPRATIKADSSKITNQPALKNAKVNPESRLREKRRTQHSYKAYTASFAVLAFLVYIILRIKYLLEAKYSSTTDFIIAWLYFYIEYYITVRHNIERVQHIFAHNKTAQNSVAAKIRDELLPTVDILILCAGEAENVILNTIRAACRQHYPKEKYRVFVSDDCNSERLRKAVCGLYSEYDNLVYITRGTNHEQDFKTGNLNFATEYSARLRETATDFVAQLDADLVPNREWLATVVKHIRSDEYIGMVAAPQTFNNIPVSDPFYQLTYPPGAGALKGALGVAQSTGSGYIIRRSALRSIGGFPRDISEDTSTSFRLMAQKWRVCGVAQKLQFGLLPNTMWGHAKQRSRWVTANFALWRTINSLRRDLTDGQGVIAYGIVFTAFYYTFFSVPLYILPVLLLSKRPLIPDFEIRKLLLATTALVLTDFFHDLLLACGPGASLQLVSRARDAQPWLAPFYTWKFLSEQRSKKVTFNVSGATQTSKATAPPADMAVYSSSHATTYPVTSKIKRALNFSMDSRITFYYTIYAGITVWAVIRILSNPFTDFWSITKFWRWPVHFWHFLLDLLATLGHFLLYLLDRFGHLLAVLITYFQYFLSDLVGNFWSYVIFWNWSIWYYFQFWNWQIKQLFQDLITKFWPLPFLGQEDIFYREELVYLVQRIFWPGFLWVDPLRWALVPLWYLVWGDEAGTAGENNYNRELRHVFAIVGGSVLVCVWGVLAW